MCANIHLSGACVRTIALATATMIMYGMDIMLGIALDSFGTGVNVVGNGALMLIVDKVTKPREE